MANLVRFTPLTRMPDFQREVDRLFDRFFTSMPATETEGTSAVWTPRVDLSETDDAYLLVVDLPGLTREDVSITFEDGTLQIGGERSFSGEGENDQYHRIERWYGRFFRSFTFGHAVMPDKIKATFKDGVLNVELPKREEKKPVRVKIS